MMQVLVTGARAPVALEMARAFSQAGHTVHTADSLNCCLAGWSNATQRHHRLPPLPQQTDSYIATLNKVVEQNDIELIIPTCEEVFYLAGLRNELSIPVFVDTLEQLDSLHNKWRFSQLTLPAGISVPETELITTPGHLEGFRAESQRWVFKPVYSRFGSQALVGPSERDFRRITPSNAKAWIAQSRVHGEEFSTYSVAHQGVVSAHSMYSCPYRVNATSGIYFQAEPISEVKQWIATFLENLSYTGQIGFDFIKDEENRWWVIEANPRGTSGMHLIPQQHLVPAVLEPSTSCNTSMTPRAQLAAAMMFWGCKQALFRLELGKLLRDVFSSREAIFSWVDPLPAMSIPGTMLGLLLTSLCTRTSLTSVSTSGIEWNGDAISK